MSEENLNKNSKAVLTPNNYREIATNGVTFIADKKEEELELLDYIASTEEEIDEIKDLLKEYKAKLKEAKNAKRELNVSLRNVRRYIKEGTRGLGDLNDSIACKQKVLIKPSYYESLYNDNTEDES